MSAAELGDELCFCSGGLEQVVEGCFCADCERVCAAEDLESQYEEGGKGEDAR